MNGPWRDYEPLPDTPTHTGNKNKRRPNMSRILQHAREDAAESCKAVHTSRAQCEICDHTYAMTFMRIVYVGSFREEHIVCSDCKAHFKLQGARNL